MKVQLIVVRGKPEGKVIPLSGPKFKIGRGETCHLRPNSEQVSREHAEFTIESNAVIVRDLGSRNGTLVNGKALTTEACKLKDRDLVQVGPLTFAVSIQDAPKPATAKPATAPAAPPAAAAELAQTKARTSPDDVPAEDIDSWLFGDNANASADQPTAVYGGDTITITAFKDSQTPPAQPNKPPSVADDAEYERQTEEEEIESEEEQTEDDETGDEDDEDEDEDEKNLEEELMDPNNPFYVAKKAQKQQGKAAPGGGSGKQEFKDSSDAANDILRKLMERRRASKS